ncbi:splicing factor 3A subunit 1 isoform X1 [Phyllobates terribilis]|uniref:splicing factor 3A subunit 1 isoform X1 n=1 Tax=Phyllobates terribilis TaxID=111132 RepID=UPI003CCAD11E
MPAGPVQLLAPQAPDGGQQQMEEEKKEEVIPAKPIVGIIYPPPEVRNIVDKTASFVARNGPEFEARIRQNEINNPKFNFLNPNDPYHAYYRHKVNEFKEGKAQEPSAAIPKVMQQQQSIQQLPQKVQAQVVQETIIPKEPPPEFEFVADPPSISAFDLDVVKLTAQFVARNGRQFLTQLMQKEQRNYQFDFLRPQHSLFNYFTKLVEQYTKILIPPKGLITKLKREAENPTEVLDQVRYRVEWAKFQERERKKEEEEKERERVAYAQIDWHDFVVVEIVDFQPNEQGNFPPPTSPEELGARILIQERYEKFGESEEVEMEVESDDEEEVKDSKTEESSQMDQDTQVQDMDEGSDDEDYAQKAPLPPESPMPPPLPPTPDQVIVRKDYDPKASKPQPPAPASDEYLVSPITGEKIPASKMQEHMRIGLLDPRWLEQRDRSIREKQGDDEVYAPGLDIESSLKQLAERRTDIFGVEETAIGKKIGEEEIQKPEEKVTWDGHSGSMARTQQAAQANISLQEQIEAIHKAKGLVPEEDGKDKIGPSKPNEINQPPPPPSSAPTIPSPAPPITSAPRPPPPVSLHQQINPPVSRPPSMPPPIRTTMVSAVPIMQRPPMASVVRLPPGSVLAAPMPPILHAPRINVLPMPPNPPPMMAQRAPHMIVPAAFVSAPPVAPLPTPAPLPPAHPPPPMDDEPSAKKMKSEDSLIPEDEFLRRNKGPVTVKVQVPNMQDKTEWKLGGQVLAFTLPFSDQVSVIKVKIHEATGMPAGKQKLQYDGIFIKDSNSLAYYNMQNGATIHLALKERGGRKK